MKQGVQLERWSIGVLKDILHNYRFKHIFLVTGRLSYVLSGARMAMGKILEPYQVVRFSEFERNPQLPDVERGLALFQEREFDVVIAVGGGSVLDMAKLIRILAAQDVSASEVIGDVRRIQRKGVPLIAIPTTAGSGSEATHFAVVYMDKRKHSVAHEHVLADVAIVDPKLTDSLPPEITAITGMDALSHAIESYWSVNSTAESKEYASEAIPLILDNLEAAVNEPSKESREVMARAAHLSGKAINISKTTASHAISYTITSFFGISHGQAVGLTIPLMVRYNAELTEQDVVDARGVDYVKRTLGELLELLKVSSFEEAQSKLTGLMRNIGLGTRFSDLGIGKNDLPGIVEAAISSERIRNNPRHLRRELLRELLMEAL